MGTRKEYLASLTPPLAKIGRGRLSAAANDEIERAIREDGMTFDDYVNGARVVKAYEAPLRTTNKNMTKSEKNSQRALEAAEDGRDFPAEDIAIPGDPAPIKAGSYDVAAVRAWGQDNGYTVADKGRVHQSVVRAYMEAHDGNLPDVSAAVEDKNRQHASRFRMQDKWTGTDVDGSKIVKTWKDCCNRCGYSIGYCGCAAGPLAFGHDTTTEVILVGSNR